MSDSVVGKTLAELNVKQLRSELERRKLSTSGIKVILSDRLERALKAEGHNSLEYRFAEESAENAAAPCTPSLFLLVNTRGFITGLAEASIQAEEVVEAEKEKKETREKTAVAASEGEAAAAKADAARGGEAAAKADAPDPEKEKEMLPRSLWVKGLRPGTKAAEVKALFTPTGHVMRAKIFTVKKGGAEGAGCLGYVTMTSEIEAEAALIKLHKTSFKGSIISVTKATAASISFTKKKEAKEETMKKEEKIESSEKEKEGEKKEMKEKEKEKEKEHRDEKKKEEKKNVKSNDDKKQTSASSRRSTDFRSKKHASTSSSRLPPRYRSHPSSRVPERNERDMMYKLMSLKETEHRQREESLRLEKERQRMRAEHERMEKERLQMQLDALQGNRAAFIAPAAPSSSRSYRESGNTRVKEDSRRDVKRERERSPPRHSRDNARMNRRREGDKRRRSRSPPRHNSSQPAFKSGVQSRPAYSSAPYARDYDSGRGSSSWLAPGRESSYAAGYGLPPPPSNSSWGLSYNSMDSYARRY